MVKVSEQPEVYTQRVQMRWPDPEYFTNCDGAGHWPSALE